MNREAFQEYLWATNLKGSGKASSYLRALDLLGEMIAADPAGFDDCINIWAVDSVDRLESLYAFANEEKRKGGDSVWDLPDVPKSYLRDGYCTAALRTYQRFLVEVQYEDRLMQEFDNHHGEEDALVDRFELKIQHPERLVQLLYPEEGQEAVRAVTTRCNQRVFRKMVLSLYHDTCCITGLNIPQVNRASHIIPWAERRDTRMDPRNGLCLSATYDAAFDRHLISLDEDYRLLVSKQIRDHFTSEIVQTYFHKREGRRITLPERFLPVQEYLTEHRSRMDA